MRVEQLAQTLHSLEKTNSRNEKKSILRETFAGLSDIKLKVVVGMLTDGRWSDAGLGKRKIKSCVSANFDDYSTVSQTLRNGNVSVNIGLSEYENRESIDTLLQLLGILDELAKMSGNEQKQKFKEIITRIENPELITQAFLNDLPTGVSSKTIVNSVVEEVDGCESDRLNGLYGDNLSQLLIDFYNSDKELTQEPEIGQPFKPMLAKPNGEPEQERIYEPKLDGYRLILHHNRLKHQRGYETKAYTRRLNDVTESLPELEEITELEEGIYDCEVLAEDGTYKSTSERIGRKNVENPETEMTFWIFDCIKSGDNDLTKLPYESRRQTLVGLTPEEQIEHVRIVPNFTNYRKAKSYAKERDLEGVMCKNPESTYTFGKRSADWRKIKYTDATVDVRITDMVEGNGRLTESMGKIKLETQEGVDVGYVGTGFSDEQRTEIWENKDEWIGEIIEVTFEDYDDGLRFPRFERIRDEGQADTEDKIKSLV